MLLFKKRNKTGKSGRRLEEEQEQFVIKASLLPRRPLKIYLTIHHRPLCKWEVVQQHIRGSLPKSFINWRHSNKAVASHLCHHPNQVTFLFASETIGINLISSTMLLGIEPYGLNLSGLNGRLCTLSHLYVIFLFSPDHMLNSSSSFHVYDFVHIYI